MGDGQECARDPDVQVVERALELIQRLPPSYARNVHARFEATLTPLLEPLEVLGARYLADASVPSPCGHSRFFAPGRPWTNLLGCFDLCGRCRDQALRALRLVREGLLRERDRPHRSIET